MSCAINAVKLFEWVLQHPGRESCFGKASDVDIVMHCDRILKNENNELFVLEKENETPLIVLWCELDSERKNIHILNILGDHGSLFQAVGAWNALYPGWTVSGARRKSKKNVQYRISDFVKQ
jgi:hypothetical protein